MNTVESAQMRLTKANLYSKQFQNIGTLKLYALS